MKKQEKLERDNHKLKSDKNKLKNDNQELKSEPEANIVYYLGYPCYL